MKISKLLQSSFLIISMIFATGSYALTQSVASAASDTAITTKIKAQIAADPTLSVFKIGVKTNHGVVQLAGLVDSDSQAGAVIQMAEATDGVKDVNSTRLKVKGSNQPYTDTAITAKVKGVYMREKLFGSNAIAVMSINVETNNGVVYLTGTADSQEQIDNAIKLAKTVRGVQRVESRVTVSS